MYVKAELIQLVSILGKRLYYFLHISGWQLLSLSVWIMWLPTKLVPLHIQELTAEYLL